MLFILMLIIKTITLAIMKIRIPDSPEEITLEQMQHLGFPKPPHTTSWEVFFKEILKLDPALFFEADMVKAYSIFLDKITNYQIKEIPKKISIGSLPESLINIKVGHLIEIVNVEVNETTLFGSNILAACFYRKDWSKEFNENEIIKGANELIKKPLIFSMYGIILKQQLFFELNEIFPILYDKGETEDDAPDNGRKSYDLLNGLAKDNPLDWDRAKNLSVATAFAYLEQKKIEAIKNKLNLQHG